MDEQRQYVQVEPIHNSSVPIQDVALKTCWERWTIETGGERGPGRSVLAVWHAAAPAAAAADDDDSTHWQRNKEVYTYPKSTSEWNHKIYILLCEMQLKSLHTVKLYSDSIPWKGVRSPRNKKRAVMVVTLNKIWYWDTTSVKYGVTFSLPSLSGPLCTRRSNTC